MMWVGIAILTVVLGASVAQAGDRIIRDGSTLCVQSWPRQASATHTRIICGLEVPPEPGMAWTMMPSRECVRFSDTSPWRCWPRPEMEQYRQAAELRELLPLLLMRPGPPVPNPGLGFGQGVLDSLAGVPPRFPGAPPSFRCQWRGNALGERYWQCDPW
jgi:hypothetical protein